MVAVEPYTVPYRIFAWDAGMDEKNFLSTHRPIHQWKAERETLRLVYRTPAAELIQTFYCQITSLHGTTQSHSRTEMST